MARTRRRTDARGKRRDAYLKGVCQAEGAQVAMLGGRAFFLDLIPKKRRARRARK
jgi:hypothetical protein